MQENSFAAQNSIDEELTIEHFDYHLPPELIAQEPAAVRHESRLMQVDRQGSSIAHRSFRDIVDILRSGDVLLLNNTRVIPARLVCRRATGGAVELLLLKPVPTRAGVWEAMATPLKKLKAGETLEISSDALDIETRGRLTVVDFVEAPDGSRRVLVDLGGQREIFELLSKIGFAPLPPYIQRQVQVDTTDRRKSDLDRYQTVFAQAPGAVAAPTAGLHFSEEILSNLKSKGVELAFLTLHVGPGTFKPISGSISEHTIEYERFEVSEEVARVVNAAKSSGRRVIAVGTTSCRAIETAGASGVVVPTIDGTTDLYIQPGYKFRILDGLLTNFHLPRSSLLLLVSAFAGYDLTKRCYEVAVKERYRFYSYGDAMLIL